jgi:type VI secretion system protein ImpA
MPIPVAELLNPISDSNPGGLNLRYDPTYEKIKESRREEEVASQGDWACELKKADWPEVIKLCRELLGNRTKDLQLAAWLTEALVKRDGFCGLQQGLELCRGMVSMFWDSLYPEAEDGAYEERSVPLEWIGTRLGDTLNQVAITSCGLSCFKYRESRAVGYEAAAENSESKRADRAQAIADGKLTAEEFDDALKSTTKDLLLQRLTEIAGCIESVDLLANDCDGRFGEFVPSFSSLRETLKSIELTVGFVLEKKRESDPDVKVAADEPHSEIFSEATDNARPVQEHVAPVVSAEPQDREDAYARIGVVAEWLRKEDPYSPVPYVMVRAMRWGELRAAGKEIDQSLLTPPATELRSLLKSLYNDGDYDQLLSLIEAAAIDACGRGWLDLQRYFCNACDNVEGYENVKTAVVSELKSLLCDYPALPKMTFMDDTPTANPETQDWLQTLFFEPDAPLLNAPVKSDEPGAETPPDVMEVAKQVAKRGHVDEAIGMLARELETERFGRARFLRHIQLAEMCMSTGHEAIAYPILQKLAGEIETRDLEYWESPDLLSHALILLFRCGTKQKESPEMMKKLHARICCLDPVAALDLKL